MAVARKVPTGQRVPAGRTVFIWLGFSREPDRQFPVADRVLYVLKARLHMRDPVIEQANTTTVGGQGVLAMRISGESLGTSESAIVGSLRQVGLMDSDDVAFLWEIESTTLDTARSIAGDIVAVIDRTVRTAQQTAVDGVRVATEPARNALEAAGDAVNESPFGLILNEWRKIREFFDKVPGLFTVLLVLGIALLAIFVAPPVVRFFVGVWADTVPKVAEGAAAGATGGKGRR